MSKDYSNASKARKLESKTRYGRRDHNSLIWARRYVARIIDRTMVLLAELGRTLIETTTTAAKVTATVDITATPKAGATAARCIGRDTFAYSCMWSAQHRTFCERPIPFDDTPAPISMSGSSKTMPPSRARPPVPPYSAVKAHLRSASVSLEMGITLMPVW